MKTLKQWRDKDEHLPRFLRDFHNQKEVFKVLADVVSRSPRADEMPNWATANAYVIDIFLWCMARYGYTLQKTRAKVDGLASLADDIEARQREEMQVLGRMMGMK